MGRLLSQMRLQLRVVGSSIRQLVSGRAWYLTGIPLLALCLFGAARFDSLSEASAAIRLLTTHAKSALMMVDPDTLVVFGPRQFVTVANNSQINFVESFSIPPRPAPADSIPAANQYTIRLQRVGGSLSIATVAVNGTQIATAADFSSANYIERQIVVNDGQGNTNSLTITLKGSAAAGLNATIVGVPDGTFAIFGPTVYSKTSATPTHYTAAFTLPSGASAPYSVSARASVAGTKATITLNGVQVIKDADFGTNITYIIRPTALSASNSMSVDVRGTTGTTITVSVLATDKTPPVLTIAAPAPNLVTNASNVTVSGTSQDQSSTQVKVNSVIATLSGTQYSATVPLVVGANTIAIRATDRAGNHVDSARTVTRDTLPPTLTVTSPADSSYTSSNSVTVAGTFSDASPVTIKANGVVIGQSSPFSGAYSGITSGVNFVTITATDAAGNITSQVRKVTQVTSPPVLTVSEPTQSYFYDGFGFYKNTTPIQVSGTVSGATPMTLTVNGASTPITNGNFSASVPLTEGWNSINIIATGPSGLVRQQVVSGKLNTNPPSFHIDVPHEPNVQSTYPWTNAPTTVFTIYPDPSAFPFVSATLNGVALTADSTGLFSGPVPLVEGGNGVTAMVTDNAGRVGVLTDSILLDSHPPTLVISSPGEGQHLSTDSVLVAGTASSGVEGEKVFLWINGEGGGLMDENFSSKVHLDSGTNVITIEAYEASGNTTTITRTVTFGAEQVPPDPGTVAPPLDATVATTTYAATSFLYSGANPIQTGVVAGTIQPLQAAVIRGAVRARTGEALPAVKVSVLDHPEFGQTLSRADGAFDLVVNGGKPLTLNYEKPGYLPAQRTVAAFWQDFANVDSVTLVNIDPQVTTVDFSQPTQVAQGSPVTDASGARQATMIFKGGTHASLILPDGTSQPLNSIAVRATEYTVGPTGPSAMPAQLPPTTAYTYAVELSVDSAIAAGAKRVVFDQPVAFYVDNFLNFPIGTPVPVGYYDKQSAQWVPSPNGRIIKVLQVVGGRASIDVDGSGTEATPEALSALGVNEAELTRLGSLFAAGKSLWRASLTHFSTLDLNFGQTIDTTSVPPTNANPTQQKSPDDDCHTGGSIIGCERQTLGESLPIAGTSLSLNYQSDRVPGYKQAYSADIPLIGATVPPNLRRIELEVRIAGQVIKQTFSNQPNQTTHFVWDGKDPYGRAVQGTQRAWVKIGYVYTAQYANVVFWSLVGDFGNYAKNALTQDPARSEATLWQDMNFTLGTHNRSAEGLGAWGIDVHHYYDPMGQVLYMGDGTRRTGTALSNSTTTIAGADCTTNCANAARPGDRAVDDFIGTEGIALAKDGTMYLTDDNANKIWHVNSAGILELVAGNGTTSPNGDSIPAISAGILPSGDVKVGPDNNVYFADFAVGQRIRRIDKNGILTTIAGTGVCGSSVADGTLATQADLCFLDFAFAKDGTLFLESQNEVYSVGTDGVLKRVVGDGTFARAPSDTVSYVRAEGKFANAHAVFHQLRGIAVAADGTLYVANREFRVPNGMVIYRIGTDGIIHRVAGNGNATGPLVDGAPAISSTIISHHSELGVGPDGTLYYTEEAGWVYRVDERGILRIIAGCVSSPAPATCNRNSGGRAKLTTLTTPRALDFGPDGRLYILDRIARRVDAPLPTLGINAVTVASADGSQLYVFDAEGRHLRTLDARLGVALHEFAYDAAGLLSSVSDADGNIVRIDRDGAGTPTVIVAPFGQRTEMTLNSQKYLSSVRGPDGTATLMSYTADGILRTFTDPNGKLHQFSYDDAGLLVRDDDPAGGFKLLTRATTDSSLIVTITTALGTSVTHSSTQLSSGANRRAIIDAGLTKSELANPNGTFSLTAPDGTVASTSTLADSRFGMQNPTLDRRTTRTPSGALSVVSGGRRTLLSDAANPLSLVSQNDSLIINGRIFRNSFVAATRTSTTTTPAGRSTTTRFDSLGHVIEASTPGIASLQYQYDTRGRLSQMTNGSRQWTYTYDTLGRLATLRDPIGRRSQYFYNSGDRLTRSVLPDGRQLLYSYDSVGNVLSITPPGRPAYHYQYNPAGLVTSYTPPSLGSGNWSTTYQYDLDGRLRTLTRPDSQTIVIGYDTAGRTTAITIAGGEIHHVYDPVSGNETSVTGPYGESLSLSYDGALPTSATWSGDVAGTVTATYNNSFQVTGLSINGGASVAFDYDSDGLLRQAGGMTIALDGTNGLLSGTTLGSVATSHSYNPLGELAGVTVTAVGNTLLDQTFARDSVGRIAAVTETLAGSPGSKAYAYDSAGRLSEVRENGIVAATYEYDSSGNRLRVTSAGGVKAGTYDDQDRLLSYGSATYTYTRAGERRTKSDGSDVTNYEYDALGNLKRVTLPNGTAIEYVIDGKARRVGKKVNGVLVQGFLYQGLLNPVAELDGQGAVVSQFVYGTRANVPDYMVRSGRTYRFITDQIGSVRLVVDAETGAIVQRLDYDAFGRVITDTQPGFQPFAYAGGLYSGETGLLRLGARDYDPEAAAWTTPDPIGFAGGSPNLRSYALDDPINLVDPHGLNPCECNAANGCDCGGINGVNAAGGAAAGGGGGLSYANKYENNPSIEGEAKLGRPNPNSRPSWDRSFHFDAPHGPVKDYHINAEFGPLKYLDHTPIPKSLYRLGKTDALAAIGRLGLVAGLALDAYTLATAGPCDFNSALGGVAGGWAGSLTCAYIGSAVLPGLGTVIGGVVGGIVGSMGGQYAGR